MWDSEEHNVPDFMDGLKKAVMGTIGSVIIFLLLKGIAEAYPEYEGIIALFIILSFIAVLEIIENSKYWGVGYTLGNLFGLYIISPLLEEWEFTLLSLVFILAIGQKIYRKYFK